MGSMMDELSLVGVEIETQAGLNLYKKGNPTNFPIPPENSKTFTSRDGYGGKESETGGADVGLSEKSVVKAVELHYISLEQIFTETNLSRLRTERVFALRIPSPP